MSAYISTGTMGETWIAHNCERCTREDVAADTYCPVLTALYDNEYPIEGLIRHADKSWPAELECTYFTPRDVTS
jgi:hypothetical protein